MKLRTLASLAFLLPLVATQLNADPLTELRATLERLRGDSPLKAQIAVRKIVKNGEEKDRGQTTQEATVIAERSARGLQLTWPSQLLAEARKAARQQAANPDAKTRQGVGLTVLDAEQAVDLLDAADSLLLDLEGASLTEDKTEPRGGRPTRLLILKPRDGLSASDRKSVKSLEDVLKIWLDDSGVPAALERSTRIRFSKLLISFSFTRHQARAFAVAGDRLVVLSASEESSGSGLGQSEETHQTARVTLLP